MAMNMDALLRIKAAVIGNEQLTALGTKLKQTQQAAVGLTKAGGLAGSALGTLAPVATIGGLTALVTKTIQTGDALYDMSQRTGVSVEALARFRKASVGTGTDIDAVAKALGKLSKGLYEAATTGKGTTAQALKSLGISAKDAAGNLKTADQVTLEIADKFKAMPDGVQKTALAMQLFGKAGAEMVPMLNQGGKAIDSMSVKMTTAFAEKADQYGDKLARLSGKVGGLAADLTVALLPALDAIVAGVTLAVDAFNALPGPVKTFIGVLAGVAIAATTLAAALAPLGSLLLGLAGTGLKTALLAPFTGLLSFMGTTFVPAMLAFFTGPVGWITLAIIAVGAMVYAFREPIGQFFAWMGQQIAGAGVAIGNGLKRFGEMIVDAVTDSWEWLQGAFNTLGEWIAGIVKTAISAVGSIGKGIIDGISGAWDWLEGAMKGVAESLSKPFSVAVDLVKGALRGLLQYIANSVNLAGSLVNVVIDAYNRLPTPDLPRVPMVQVPSFEGGGYTGSGPRVGGIDGRGGFLATLHPQETVIDHTRGAAAALGAGTTVAPASAPSITIQTGPVYRLPDGTDTVSVGDLQAAMQATASAVMGQLRTPAGRMAMKGA